MPQPQLKYQLKVSLSDNNHHHDLDPTLNLLTQIDIHENLQIASSYCNYSYRKAWNILKEAEHQFGQPLVEKQRGKGSQLSTLGKALLETTKDSNLFIKDILITEEDKANVLLESLKPVTEVLQIIASDSEILEQLRKYQLAIELHIDGSGQALSAYAEKTCELAGFHFGINDNNHKQIENHLPYFDPKQDKFILLESRQQGIISHPDRPVISFQQMIEQQLTFVNRQNGSGTRNLLNTLLKKQNINPNQLNGYYHEEHTHLAVASMVSSKQADAGLGIHSAAKRLKLQFTPISNELYFLVFKSLTPTIQQVIDKLSEHNSLEIINYKQFIKLISS